MAKAIVIYEGEDYRGCRIRPRFKTVNKRNPISGHEWTEHEVMPGKSVTVSGCPGIGCTRVFGSPKSAKEWIDFYLKFPPVIVRSEREIVKAKRLGLPY